jgi:ABC-type polysaccharide/polyol phosphate export permease
MSSFNFSPSITQSNLQNPVPVAKTSDFSSGLRDIIDALRNYPLICTLGWQDVATRYRRSRVGAFWLTINISVMIGSLGLVFGTLLGQPMREFLPFLAVGFIIWNFIAASINEGCTALSDSSGIVLQVKMPLWVHIGRVMWKNLIIFGHNFAIIPLVFVFFWRPVSPVALLAIPGFVLLILNLLWMMMLCSVVCARFRDVTQIVTNTVQVLFYITPVIWNAEIMSHRVGSSLLYSNPFYSLMSIVRAPLLGDMPSTMNWVIATGVAAIGWTISLWFYCSRLKRVPYWL